MSSCCTLRATGEPGSCGVCGERGKPVPRETLEHLLKPEKRAEIIDQPYYFCETPECDIVYFTDLPLHYFDKDDLTVRVGAMSPSPRRQQGHTENHVRESTAR